MSPTIDIRRRFRFARAAWLLAGVLLALFTGIAGVQAQADKTAPALADPAWLVERIGAPDTKIIQVRSRGVFGFFGGPKRLPGAVETDYRKEDWRVKDKNGVIDQMPPVPELERLIGNFGIGPDDHVIIVANDNDEYDIGAAARIFWTFRVLGHKRLTMIDGGMPAVEEIYDGPWAEDDQEPAPVSYTAKPHDYLRATQNTVKNFRYTGTLVDYRTRDEFTGDKRIKETRRRGTIPGAINLPVAALITEEGRLRPVDELEKAFVSRGIDMSLPHIAFCNTGHRAAIGWFAASELLGHGASRLYDGSLVEWSSDRNAPLKSQH